MTAKHVRFTLAGQGVAPILLPALFGSGLVSYAADNIGTNSRVTAPATTIAVARLRDRARREGCRPPPKSKTAETWLWGPGLRKKQPHKCIRDITVQRCVDRSEGYETRGTSRGKRRARAAK